MNCWLVNWKLFSRPDALDGRAHARQPVGIVELIEARGEEGLGLVGFGHAALGEQDGHRRGSFAAVSMRWAASESNSR